MLAFRVTAPVQLVMTRRFTTRLQGESVGGCRMEAAGWDRLVPAALLTGADARAAWRVLSNGPCEAGVMGFAEVPEEQHATIPGRVIL